MSNLGLLRVMVLKEIRTTFRERAQLRGLIISIAILVIVLVTTLTRLQCEARRQPRATAPGTVAQGQVTPGERRLTEDEMRIAPWAAIGGAAGLGFFLAAGYLIAAVLSSFVGEKEARTLEILLVSPISDRRLYFVKCVSVLLPSAGIGYGFVVGASLLALSLSPIPLPASLLLYALVLGPVVMILPMLWFVGLGAGISVRAETMKGAGQVLSGVLMAVVFGLSYGIPLLLSTVPSLRAPVWQFLQQWLTLPFVVQYGTVLVLFGSVAAICLAFGKWSFRRDRMLT